LCSLRAKGDEYTTGLPRGLPLATPFVSEMILVTGATGFVGRHVVRELGSRGQRLRVLTRDPARVPPGIAVEIARGDVLDPASLPAALAGVDAVVHLAASVPAPGAPAARVRETNVQGTADLAEAAVRAGVRRFVLGSSAGVYGDGRGTTPHREDSSLHARSDYERSKAEAEGVVRDALGRSKVDLVLLRIAGVYGPGRPATLAFYRELLRRRLWLHGPATLLVHPTYVGDVAQAIGAAIVAPGAAGRTLNIAGERAITYRDLIDLTARLLGVGVLQIGAPRWVAGMARRVINRSVDTSLARQVLGFRAAPLESSTRDTIAWFRREGLL
jgi:nucleoside-diphosphate-sugar epimerase